MRLINVDTFTLQEFAGAGAAPPYAILSHTWGEDEVSFLDIQNLDLMQSKDGFDKIRCTCLQAKANGLHYAWVDTCCIDKSSSHELSEAINSMYRWYMSAAVCYVYLSDVPGNCPALNTDYVHPSQLRWIETFEESRWFTRGWTLQELIAPRQLLFFGCAWNPIGGLEDLVDRVAGITSIQSDVLDHTRPLCDISIARRLSWAARRETTRIEDVAYSLFGVLEVNMPLLYGEGSKAFMRLQEELIRQSTDQSIFAWDAPPGFIESRELLLAPSPRCFANGSRIRRRRGTASESAFRISNKGLEITLPTVRWRLDPASPYVTLGILDCRYEGSPDVLALVMSQHPFNIQGGTPALELYVSGFKRRIGATTQYARLTSVSPASVEDATPTLLTITKDLQSQTYIQAFNANAVTWFPVRFMGSEPSSIPTLQDIYPEDCWYEGSKTMRLRNAHGAAYGGVAVNIKDGRLVLVTFGVYCPAFEAPTTTRRIGKLVFVDRDCPLDAHVETLISGNSSGAKRGSACLRLNNREQLIAQLWCGALTVSIEKATDNHMFAPSSPQALSPPSSPEASVRRTSFSTSRRRDSLLQDVRSRYPDGPRDEGHQDVHRTSRCTHCRDVWAREEAERVRRKEERNRRLEEEEAKRVKHERQEKFKTRAKQAGVGLSLGGIIADMAEVAEFM